MVASHVDDSNQNITGSQQDLSRCMNVAKAVVFHLLRDPKAIQRYHRVEKSWKNKVCSLKYKEMSKKTWGVISRSPPLGNKNTNSRNRQKP